MIRCPFCLLVQGKVRAPAVWDLDDCLAIVPIRPVTKGHILILPKVHVEDFSERPDIYANVSRHASQLCKDNQPYNVITSKGRAATQSIYHLHVHIIPRSFDDGLPLPWHTGIHTL